MNLFETCLKFHKKNITWPIINIIFVLVYYPLEMIIFGFLFGKIFLRPPSSESNQIFFDVPWSFEYLVRLGYS